MSTQSNSSIRAIYLAGKIAQNDWRHTLVANLRAHEGGECGDESALLQISTWPILEGAIFGQYDYTGPFFISCDHGCFHGPISHGVGANGAYFRPRSFNPPDIRAIHIEHLGAENEQLEPNVAARRRTLDLCVRAIERSDLLFAWIDSQDVYGTIAEVGYAAALGKPTWIAGPVQFDELWLAYTMANRCYFGDDAPETALAHMLKLAQIKPETELE